MELDNFSIVVPVDYPLHTLDKLFCYDPICPDKEDELLIAEVAQFVTDGLMTPDEAADFIAGRGI
jgi:hypothetical protein